MRTLSTVLAIVAAVSLLPVASDAAPNTFAFRTFSKAKFVSIGDRLCGPGGNPRACCLFNGGLWRTLPRPHCLFI